MNIKPAWAAKGINLKEFDRAAFTSGSFAAAKPVATRAERTAEFERLTAEWIERASLKARFLNAANRQHYKRLDPDAKAAWLSHAT